MVTLEILIIVELPGNLINDWLFSKMNNLLAISNSIN